MIVLTGLLAAAAAAAPPQTERPLGALAMMPPRVAVPGAPRATREQVLAAVRAEWSRFDLRRTGRLGPLEFSTWVLRANGVTVAPAGRAGVRPVTAMNATSRAFALADADHDGGVTPEEMAAFLMR